jgi:FtsZ-binding cell division protein ZapB
MPQRPRCDRPGDDPLRQLQAASARLLERLDNAQRYFRVQRDQIAALEAEIDALKATMTRMQAEIETLKTANAQLQRDLEHGHDLRSAAYAESHTFRQERNALRETVEALRLENLRLVFEANLHSLNSMDTKRTPAPGDGGQAPETLFLKLLALCHPDKWDQGQLATTLAHELTVELNRLRQGVKDT